MRVTSRKGIVRELSLWMARIAGGALGAIVFLVVGNILSRLVWQPILGTFELVSLLGGVVISLGLAHCAIEKGHVALSVLVERLSPRVQTIIDRVTTIFSLFISGLIAWQCIVYGTAMLHEGYVSDALAIPIFPFIYGTAFGFGVLCLVLLVELYESLAKVITR